MLAVVIILNIMETIKKEEIKQVNFKCKAILLGEVKIYRDWETDRKSVV